MAPFMDQLLAHQQEKVLQIDRNWRDSMKTTPSNAPFFVDNEVIVLTKNGIWIADEVEISHEPTRKLFAKSLKKDPNGYHLHIGKETKQIQVEDTAYFVHRIDGSAEEGYQVWLSDETQEFLDPKTLKYRPARLTCKIKNGTEEAKFLHAAYFDLLKDLKQDMNSYYLEFGGKNNVIHVNLSEFKN
jgi:hypothetical protein